MSTSYQKVSLNRKIQIHHVLNVINLNYIEQRHKQKFILLHRNRFNKPLSSGIENSFFRNKRPPQKNSMRIWETPWAANWIQHSQITDYTQLFLLACPKVLFPKWPRDGSRDACLEHFLHWQDCNEDSKKIQRIEITWSMFLALIVADLEISCKK